MGQVLGTFVGLLIAFVFTFLILMFGGSIHEDLINPAIVADFINRPDLEFKLAIVGTVLYPPFLGMQLGFGAQGSTILMFLAWGVGGLIAGLLARDIVPGILAAVLSVVIGAFLIWLLVFFIGTVDFMALFGGESMLILQFVLEGALYPGIAAAIGGLIGGAIMRDR
ncbi:MAG: hypothetical protein K9W43_02210 [Candidatus Thorarchaeota archaeon]|nr:hypothetical protein [Candidatus Thorarchaeota archaeon]